MHTIINRTITRDEDYRPRGSEKEPQGGNNTVRFIVLKNRLPEKEHR